MKYVHFMLLTVTIATVTSAVTDTASQQFEEAYSSEARVITIDQAIQSSLRSNFGLKSDSLEIAVQIGNLQQAGLPENPEVVLESDELGVSNGKVKNGSSLSVDIEQSFHPVARWKRTTVGKSEVRIAHASFEKQKRDLIAETKTRFIEALALQKKKSLADSLVEISQKAHQVSVSQAIAGKVSISDTLKTSAELSLAQIQRDRIIQSLGNAYQDLAALWNSNEIDFSCQGTELDSTANLPDMQSVLSHVSDYPHSKIADAELKKEHSELALEKALRIPAIRAGAGIGMIAGTDDLTPRASLSISIPFLNWNQGAIKAAKERVKQAEYRREATKIQTQKDVLNVFREASEALREVKILRQSILPQLRESFDASYKAYLSGKTGVLSLIDAQQSLYEASMNSIEVSRDLQFAIIELERISNINEPIGKPASRSYHE